MNKHPTTNNYIQDIKTILELACKKSYTTRNTIMLEAYRKIGERIVLQEQNGNKRAKYGESILKELSQALMEEFESRNLIWSHNRLIMRVENEVAGG